MLKSTIYWIMVVIALFIPDIIIAQNAPKRDSELDSLIERAMINNPGIQGADYAYRAKNYKSKYAGALPDPVLSIAASNLPRSSLALDETPMTGIAIGITQKIPWFSKLGNLSSIANLDAEKAGFNKELIANETEMKIKQVYYNYSYWKLADSILDRYTDLTEALVEVAQTRYANGDGLAQDVLNAQTSLVKLEDREREAVRMTKSALSDLRRLTGIPEEIDDLKGDLPGVLRQPIAIDPLIALAMENNPLIKSAESNIAISEKRESLAKAEYMPDIFLGFEYRIREEVAMDALPGEDFVSAKVGFSIPLWFGFKQNHKVDEASAMRSTSESERYSIELFIKNEIENTLLEIDRKAESIKLYEDSIIPLAKAALESSDIAYRVGKTDFLNRIMAQTRLMEFELERLKLLMEYNSALADIDELTGAKMEAIQ
ncbi:MAG: hypothetical protein GF307_01625 [candidate division Zixibacteria bacterium]|nr:hypothetical protein [candidate division Zixibacteria bacterium]